MSEQLENQNFIKHSTNTFLTILLFNSMFNFFTDVTGMNFSMFFLICLLTIFYNVFGDTLIETQGEYLNTLRIFVSKYTFSFFDCVKKTTYSIMNKFVSKNTQFILKFVINIAKNNIVSRYKYYKNLYFNPPLITQTKNEDVYCVSYYLNGEKYKIPIVVTKLLKDKKYPPLMVLNQNEEDITQDIIDYMGPNYDFYGMFLKPSYLNQSNLNFMMNDGSEMNIEENDIMAI